VVGGDTRPDRAVPPLARDLRHGGGSGACVRRGGEAAQRREGEDQLQDTLCAAALSVVGRWCRQAESGAQQREEVLLRGAVVQWRASDSRK